MSKQSSLKWETVPENYRVGTMDMTTYLERTKVPGGYLYRTREERYGRYGLTDTVTALTFVPDPPQGG